MKCVECKQSLEALYEEPIKGNIALVTCPQCSNIADRYIENDYTVIFINLVLCKPQVYRHLVFNEPRVRSISDVLKLLVIASVLESLPNECDGIVQCFLEVVQSGACVVGFFYGSLIGAKVFGLEYGILDFLRCVLISSFGILGNFLIVTW